MRKIKKKDFEIALKIDGTTMRKWAKTLGVTVGAVSLVSSGRSTSARLEKEIQEYTEKVLREFRKGAAA